MSTPMFTAGPWRRVGHRAIAAGAQHDTVTICEVFSGGAGIDQADANEALIATAPELFAAATEICNLIDSGFLAVGIPAADNDTHVAACGRAIDALATALAKASGRAGA